MSVILQAKGGIRLEDKIKRKILDCLIGHDKELLVADVIFLVAPFVLLFGIISASIWPFTNRIVAEKELTLSCFMLFAPVVFDLLDFGPKKIKPDTKSQLKFWLVISFWLLPSIMFFFWILKPVEFFEDLPKNLIIYASVSLFILSLVDKHFYFYFPKRNEGH